MDIHDLNIDNYDINDILHLFQISINFNEEDLKKAKKIVLKTHPDKSGLSPDIFLFYSKAYKQLYSIWEFSNKYRISKNNNNYTIDDLDEKNHKNQLTFSKDKKKILTKLFSDDTWEDPNKFNQWFNNAFEKNYIVSEDDSNGYDTWFKSDQDIEIVEGEIFNEEDLIQKKKNIRDLTIHKEILEVNSFGSYGTSLNQTITNDYTSDPFSNLCYEDLKKAYTETVIPVTIDDFDKIPKFKSINDYESYRNSQNLIPLSEKQATEYLNNKINMDNSETNYRSYYLTKQTEIMNKKQDEFWTNLTKITNK
jgi:hypothetical protein